MWNDKSPAWTVEECKLTLMDECSLGECFFATQFQRETAYLIGLSQILVFGVEWPFLQKRQVAKMSSRLGGFTSSNLFLSNKKKLDDIRRRCEFQLEFWHSSSCFRT